MRIGGNPGSPVPLAAIDLVAPERYRSGDQHPAWRTLRQQAPVWWHDRGGQTGFWCVTRHADCERVLKDHRSFSSAGGTILASVGAPDPAGGRTISLMDPPRHTVLRTTAMRWFSHSVVRRRAGRIRGHVRALADRLAAGEIDFAALARRLPMAVTGELMGIPERYWDDLAHWTAVGLAPEDPAWSPGPDVDATLRRAHHEIFASFLEIIQAVRARPGDDLISALIRLAPDGRPMDDRTVLMNCYSFMAGANSTTPHVAAHTLLALIERPALWHELAAAPDLLGALVEEGARWTSTPHHLVRRAVTEVRLGGVRIAAGDWVAAWLPSANRDETVFTDPYTFSLRRPSNPHLGFGAGPHYCIGAPLSRMALTMLFEELLGRFERIEPAGPPRHLYSNWINGLTSMPVAVTPRRRVRGAVHDPVAAMEDARAHDHP
ncbi:cytochrome P450 [Paractinoplanes rishiriensis]|uniref:Cytochrome P450 n=1 Tax=Paractinoplanes rishiriensis TaxID=1050105 RepID=A0A919K3I1_9ACTN|nr:cytochrome P450 [Actinoplanes rishiriensis]GIE99523.1 cytochrome P450 [Actinoplanes rishiriensis]